MHVGSVEVGGHMLSVLLLQVSQRCDFGLVSMVTQADDGEDKEDGHHCPHGDKNYHYREDEEQIIILETACGREGRGGRREEGGKDGEKEGDRQTSRREGRREGGEEGEKEGGRERGEEGGGGEREHYSKEYM